MSSHESKPKADVPSDDSGSGAPVPLLSDDAIGTAAAEKALGAEGASIYHEAASFLHSGDPEASFASAVSGDPAGQYLNASSGSVPSAMFESFLSDHATSGRDPNSSFVSVSGGDVIERQNSSQGEQGAELSSDGDVIPMIEEEKSKEYLDDLEVQPLDGVDETKRQECAEDEACENGDLEDNNEGLLLDRRSDSKTIGGGSSSNSSKPGSAEKSHLGLSKLDSSYGGSSASTARNGLVIDPEVGVGYVVGDFNDQIDPEIQADQNRCKGQVPAGENQRQLVEAEPRTQHVNKLHQQEEDLHLDHDTFRKNEQNNPGDRSCSGGEEADRDDSSGSNASRSRSNPRRKRRKLLPADDEVAAPGVTSAFASGLSSPGGAPKPITKVSSISKKSQDGGTSRRADSVDLEADDEFSPSAKNQDLGTPVGRYAYAEERGNAELVVTGEKDNMYTGVEDNVEEEEAVVPSPLTPLAEGQNNAASYLCRYSSSSASISKRRSSVQSAGVAPVDGDDEESSESRAHRQEGERLKREKDHQRNKYAVSSVWDILTSGVSGAIGPTAQQESKEAAKAEHNAEEDNVVVNLNPRSIGKRNDNDAHQSSSSANVVETAIELEQQRKELEKQEQDYIQKKVAELTELLQEEEADANHRLSLYSQEKENQQLENEMHRVSSIIEGKMSSSTSGKFDAAEQGVDQVHDVRDNQEENSTEALGEADNAPLECHFEKVQVNAVVGEQDAVHVSENSISPPMKSRRIEIEDSDDEDLEFALPPALPEEANDGGAFDQVAPAYSEHENGLEASISSSSSAPPGPKPEDTRVFGPKRSSTSEAEDPEGPQRVLFEDLASTLDYKSPLSDDFHEAGGAERDNSEQGRASENQRDEEGDEVMGSASASTRAREDHDSDEGDDVDGESMHASARDSRSRRRKRPWRDGSRDDDMEEDENWYEARRGDDEERRVDSDCDFDEDGNRRRHRRLGAEEEDQDDDIDRDDRKERRRRRRNRKRSRRRENGDEEIDNDPEGDGEHSEQEEMEHNANNRLDEDDNDDSAPPRRYRGSRGKGRRAGKLDQNTIEDESDDSASSSVDEDEEENKLVNTSGDYAFTYTDVRGAMPPIPEDEEFAEGMSVGQPGGYSPLLNLPGSPLSSWFSPEAVECADSDEEGDDENLADSSEFPPADVPIAPPNESITGEKPFADAPLSEIPQEDAATTAVGVDAPKDPRQEIEGIIDEDEDAEEEIVEDSKKVIGGDIDDSLPTISRLRRVPLMLDHEQQPTPSECKDTNQNSARVQRTVPILFNETEVEHGTDNEKSDVLRQVVAHDAQAQAAGEEHAAPAGAGASPANRRSNGTKRERSPMQDFALDTHVNKHHKAEEKENVSPRKGHEPTPAAPKSQPELAPIRESNIPNDDVSPLVTPRDGNALPRKSGSGAAVSDAGSKMGQEESPLFGMRPDGKPSTVSFDKKPVPAMKLAVTAGGKSHLQVEGNKGNSKKGLQSGSSTTSSSSSASAQKANINFGVPLSDEDKKTAPVCWTLKKDEVTGQVVATPSALPHDLGTVTSLTGASASSISSSSSAPLFTPRVAAGAKHSNVANVSKSSPSASEAVPAAASPSTKQVRASPPVTRLGQAQKNNSSNDDEGVSPFAVTTRQSFARRSSPKADIEEFEAAGKVKSSSTALAAAGASLFDSGTGAYSGNTSQASRKMQEGGKSTIKSVVSHQEKTQLQVGVVAGIQEEQQANRASDIVGSEAAPGPEQQSWSTSVDDCTALMHLDERSILENLRVRYEHKAIYTSAAKVLLAVNPLGTSPDIDALYSLEKKQLYQLGNRLAPPHPFGVADLAYRQLLHDGQNQVLIISGVSGAGKTETAKIAMSYLAYRSRSNELAALEVAEKMLSLNPLLESFGNAATVRNCNSSRFGKYNALRFNVVGHLQSAEIQTFLLESSRVTSCASGERSYHAFYELLAAADEQYLARNGLHPRTGAPPSSEDNFASDGEHTTSFREPNVSYRLAQQEDIGFGSEHCVFRRDDAANFAILERELKTVLSESICESIFDILCGLIHLAELDVVIVERNCAADSVTLEKQQHVEHAARILGFEVEKLREILTTKWVVVGGRERYQVPRTKAQAVAFLHSLSKFLYRKLFDFVVARVNAALMSKNNSGAGSVPSSVPGSPELNAMSRRRSKRYSAELQSQALQIAQVSSAATSTTTLQAGATTSPSLAPHSPPLSQQQNGDTQTNGFQLGVRLSGAAPAGIMGKTIGILDIYGFEQLERNSFEQLCINLANEHLQQFFVDNVLLGEQELYRREGLQWKPVSCPDCTECVSAIGSCFKMLDDCCFRVARMSQQEVTAATFTQSVHTHFCTDRKASAVGVVKEPKRGRNVAGVDSILKTEGFVISHFAGDITYHTSEWLEKNNSRLDLELEALVAQSTNSLVATFVPPPEPEAPKDGDEDAVAKSSSRPPPTSTSSKDAPVGSARANKNNANLSTFDSVSKKYLNDLNALLTNLQSANLHYIRCFCPNAEQEPFSFDAQTVLTQMRESGTFQLVNIMHHGYPHRCDYKFLAEKFKKFLPSSQLGEQYDARTFIDLLMLALRVPKHDYVMGISKLFLKSGKLAILQRLLAENADMVKTVAHDLQWHFLRKKLRRCFLAVRFVLYVNAFSKRCRKDRLERGLVTVSRTLVRLVRWHRRAQRRLLCADRWQLCLRGVRMCVAMRRFARRKYFWRWIARLVILKRRLRAAVKHRRERKARRYQAKLNWDLLLLTTQFGILFRRVQRWRRVRRASIRDSNLTMFCRYANLGIVMRSYVRRRRDDIRDAYEARQRHLLRTLRGYVHMTVQMRRLLGRARNSIEARRIEADRLAEEECVRLEEERLREEAERERQAELERTALAQAEARERKIRQRALFEQTLFRTVLLCGALKRHIAASRFEREQRRMREEQARELQAMEVGRQNRVKELLHVWARASMLFVRLRRYCIRYRDESSRRRDAAIKISAFMHSLAEYRIRRQVLVEARQHLLQQKAEEHRRRAAEQTAQQQDAERAAKQEKVQKLLDTFYCGTKLVVEGRRFVRRWLEEKALIERKARESKEQQEEVERQEERAAVETQKKQKARESLLRHFVRSVFVSIRLRRWMRRVSERVLENQVERHLTMVSKRKRLVTIVYGLVLLKRTVRAWMARKRAKDVQRAAGAVARFVHTIRVLRGFRRWVRAYRRNKKAASQQQAFDLRARISRGSSGCSLRGVVAAHQLREGSMQSNYSLPPPGFDWQKLLDRMERVEEASRRTERIVIEQGGAYDLQRLRQRRSVNLGRTKNEVIAIVPEHEAQQTGASSSSSSLAIEPARSLLQLEDQARTEEQGNGSTSANLTTGSDGITGHETKVGDVENNKRVSQIRASSSAASSSCYSKEVTCFSGFGAAAKRSKSSFVSGAQSVPRMGSSGGLLREDEGEASQPPGFGLQGREGRGSGSLSAVSNGIQLRIEDHGGQAQGDLIRSTGQGGEENEHSAPLPRRPRTSSEFTPVGLHGQPLLLFQRDSVGLPVPVAPDGGIPESRKRISTHYLEIEAAVEDAGSEAAGSRSSCGNAHVVNLDARLVVEQERVARERTNNEALLGFADAKSSMVTHNLSQQEDSAVFVDAIESPSPPKRSVYEPPNAPLPHHGRALTEISRDSLIGQQEHSSEPNFGGSSSSDAMRLGIGTDDTARRLAQRVREKLIGPFSPLLEAASAVAGSIGGHSIGIIEESDVDHAQAHGDADGVEENKAPQPAPASVPIPPRSEKVRPVVVASRENIMGDSENVNPNQRMASDEVSAGPNVTSTSTNSTSLVASRLNFFGRKANKKSSDARSFSSDGGAEARQVSKNDASSRNSSLSKDHLQAPIPEEDLPAISTNTKAVNNSITFSFPEDLGQYEEEIVQNASFHTAQSSFHSALDESSLLARPFQRGDSINTGRSLSEQVGFRRDQRLDRRTSPALQRGGRGQPR
ncbi:unnamed protein product [Amoebophrya sp. A25]|nr:unnamed protein product [Amoebophrya sp. A25]|eukprot:GSA25T00018891001.1